MRELRRAALGVAFLLTACGGGGGGDSPAPAPAPAAVTQAEALRLSGQAVMDLTTLAWALAADVQNTLVTAPSEDPRTASCPQGGQTLVSRPVPTLLRIEHRACRFGELTFGGIVEADGAVVSQVSEGARWSGTVRMDAFSAVGTGSSPRAQTVSVTATGTGTVGNRAQSLTLQLSGLSARRSPSALGRDATVGSASLRVERVPASLLDDLYALEGCASFTAAGLAAELCIDAGSRIGLVQNIGNEQLTGRLRWNAGTPGGFDARLRITPAGPAGTSALRIELDLDNNGSFEAVATLDRSTDIGLRL